MTSHNVSHPDLLKQIAEHVATATGTPKKSIRAANARLNIVGPYPGPGHARYLLRHPFRVREASSNSLYIKIEDA